MFATLSREEIERALHERNFGSLHRFFSDLEPADVAEAMDALEPHDRAVAFRLLQRDQAADTFEYLSPESQEGLIKALAQEEVAAILNEMSPDDRTQLLEELPASVTRQALAWLSPEERAVARQLLGYPEDSIGRLMTPDFMAVRGDWTVQQALDHIRRHGQDSETLNVIHVADDRGHLIDDLRVRQLLLAAPESRISEICDGKFISLSANDGQESAVPVFKEYDRVALPVIDSNGVLLGIVTVDDVLDVAEEEATEDIQKIGGSEPLEQPFMQIGFWEMWAKRVGWLVLLFMGQLLTLNAIGLYSDKIAESSGGNSGSQAATLVIRAMALGEVSSADWWRVMRREILFGLTLGVILAGIGIARVFLGNFGDEWGKLSIAIGISLVSVVLWGVVIGSMLPFLLKKIGADPATSSAPFVTTVVDVTGLLIYLAVATAVLS
jgi:magnesium transporter